MSTLGSPPLVAGQKLTREDFLRRWEAMPELKHAELIGGLVYMPSPVSLPHGSHHALVVTWLTSYAVRTPGCRAAASTTWWMLEDAPQPDADLRILPGYGGQSRQQGIYSSGAPELAAEVCLSTADYDLGPKLELFQTAGVLEYLAVLLADQRVLWQRLVGGRYALLEPGRDGILRSLVFPGLWLDPAALLAEHGHGSWTCWTRGCVRKSTRSSWRCWRDEGPAEGPARSGKVRPGTSHAKWITK